MSTHVFGQRIAPSTTASSATWQCRPMTLYDPMRAPRLMTAPASTKHGASSTAPSSIRASGETIRAPGVVANGGAAKRPSMMSRCAWRYFSGVPMSIQ